MWITFTSTHRHFYFIVWKHSTQPLCTSFRVWWIFLSLLKDFIIMNNCSGRYFCSDIFFLIWNWMGQGERRESIIMVHKVFSQDLFWRNIWGYKYSPIMTVTRLILQGHEGRFTLLESFWSYLRISWLAGEE